MLEHQLNSWLQAYGRAWETNDTDGFVALFSDDAVYEESPFAEPMVGTAAIRAYAEQMEQYQGEVAFTFEILSAAPAIALFGASYNNLADGIPTQLDGVFLLGFDDAGLCTSLREWWHADPAPAFRAASPV
ncbi:MAG: nuclear transport factor 2 family protein [Acidimicrobiia bacterium]|nr:nuclear transport factor 2 family protein [Acidimicrobiia bacterium]